jgi:hypothetical protein
MSTGCVSYRGVGDEVVVFELLLLILSVSLTNSRISLHHDSALCYILQCSTSVSTFCASFTLLCLELLESCDQLLTKVGTESKATTVLAYVSCSALLSHPTLLTFPLV